MSYYPYIQCITRPMKWCTCAVMRLCCDALVYHAAFSALTWRYVRDGCSFHWRVPLRLLGSHSTCAGHNWSLSHAPTRKEARASKLFSMRATGWSNPESLSSPREDSLVEGIGTHPEWETSSESASSPSQNMHHKICGYGRSSSRKASARRSGSKEGTGCGWIKRIM